MSRSEEKRGPTPHSVRAFICIDIPESIRERLADLQGGLRAAGAQVSWTKPSNIHLTIKFLGDIPASNIEAIREALRRAATSSPPFEIEVGGAGCFPSPRSPRVLWVGLSRLPDALEQLHSAVEDQLSRIAIPREARRFAPHLTIGRIRGPQNSKQVAEELARRGFAPETFLAREIVLMRSDLKPAGPIYTPLATISLVKDDLMQTGFQTSVH